MLTLYAFVVLDAAGLVLLGIGVARLLRAAQARAARETMAVSSHRTATPVIESPSVPAFRRRTGVVHDLPVDYRTEPIHVTQIPIVRTRPEPATAEPWSWDEEDAAIQPETGFEAASLFTEPPTHAPANEPSIFAPLADYAEPEPALAAQPESSPGELFAPAPAKTQTVWQEALCADPLDGMPFQPGEPVVACHCGAAYRVDTAEWLRHATAGKCLHCQQELTTEIQPFAATREPALTAH